MFDIDWQGIFAPSTPILELFIRGSLVYLTLFWLMRFILNRHLGTIGAADLLTMVLIASAVQNALGGYKSVTEGILLVATILFWNYIIDWLGFHFPLFQRLLRPGPVPLVKRGRLLRHNMQKELITEDELMSILREQGVDAVSDVKKALMESDGRVSVVTKDDQPAARGTPDRQI